MQEIFKKKLQNFKQNKIDNQKIKHCFLISSIILLLEDAA